MLLNGLGIRLFCDHRRNCRSKHAPVSDFILVLRLLASQTLLCCAYRHSLYSPSSASPCLIFTVFYIHRALPTPFLHPALPSPCFLTLRTLNIPLSLYPHPMWCDVWVWASALQPHTLTLSHTLTHTLSLVLVVMMKSKELKTKTSHAHSLILSVYAQSNCR